MAKFFGKIGYAITAESDDKPGVWKEQIVERNSYGDLLRNTSRRYDNQEFSTNPNITITNNISIIADAFAFKNFSNIKYVEFMGTKWIVTSVEVQHPRLILTLGGVYNG